MNYEGINAPMHRAPHAVAVDLGAAEAAPAGVAGSRPARRTGALYGFTKRTLDLVVAMLLVIVLSPLLLLVALLVRVTSAGPAIFRQTRIGQDGRPFTMYKFRSMHAGADPHVHQMAIQKYIRGELLTESSPKVRFKLTKDMRVTPLGKVLRKTSIDELPQLFNVIRGEMSLVGPRPALPYELPHFSESALVRLSVPQGITGLWQVRGRGQATWEQSLALDVEYAEHCSFLLDCKILLLTIRSLVFAVGGA